MKSNSDQSGAEAEKQHSGRGKSVSKGWSAGENCKQRGIDGWNMWHVWGWKLERFRQGYMMKGLVWQAEFKFYPLVG